MDLEAEIKNKILYEKFRPRKLTDCVLIPRIEEKVINTISGESTLPLFFYGKSGLGKTTLARVIGNEMDCEVLFIKASMNGNIDTIRNSVQQFAGTLSIDNKQKMVIFDEADGITFTAQQSLRGLLDEFNGHCIFIFTANYPQRILPELISRFNQIDFSLSKEELNSLFKKYCLRVGKKLKEENIVFNMEAILYYVKTYAPDWRKIWTAIQNNIHENNLLIEDKSSSDEEFVDSLEQALRSKNFNTIKVWTEENPSVEPSAIFKTVFENITNWFIEKNHEEAIIITGDYMYKSAFVVDQSINTVAFLVTLAANVDFK